MRPEEYCPLFFNSGVACMSRADWAAWASFMAILIGSIAAVIAIRMTANIARRQQDAFDVRDQKLALSEGLRGLAICDVAMREMKGIADAVAAMRTTLFTEVEKKASTIKGAAAGLADALRLNIPVESIETIDVAQGVARKLASLSTAGSEKDVFSAAKQDALLLQSCIDRIAELLLQLDRERQELNARSHEAYSANRRVIAPQALRLGSREQHEVRRASRMR